MKGLLKISTLLLVLIPGISGFGNQTIGQSKDKFLSKISQIGTDNYKPEWDFYVSNVDHKISSLFVDLGLYKVAPIEGKANFIWISVKMKDALPNGLSSWRESELLKKMEDNLVRRINSNFHSTYVGNLTSNRNRDFFFYIGDTLEYEKVIEGFIRTFPDYEIEYGMKRDENWNGYFNFLYPTPQQFQSIQNRRIIDQLEKNGDNLTKMRQVNHWIYFKTKRDRDLFLKKIMFDGFTVITQDFDKKSGGLPYKLHINRIDRVDWESVDSYVIYLWKLANEFDGVYDGWETSIVAD